MPEQTIHCSLFMGVVRLLGGLCCNLLYMYILLDQACHRDEIHEEFTAKVATLSMSPNDGSSEVVPSDMMYFSGTKMSGAQLSRSKVLTFLVQTRCLYTLFRDLVSQRIPLD